MTAEFRDLRLDDHKYFSCPAGHQQHYTGKTKAQKLQDQLDIANNQRRDAENIAEQANEELKIKNLVIGHIKIRAKNGVCLCCNRYFENVHKHMQTKHKNEFNFAIKLKLFRKQSKLTQREIADLLGLSSGQVSNYERDKPVPAYAKETLDEFVEDNSL